MPNNQNSRFTPYKNALKLLSSRTGAPLPSLLLSFGILHEVTALIPLVGVFYGARALGIGETVVTNIIHGPSIPTGEAGHWLQEKSRHWAKEGEGWALRIGRRYGIFGVGEQTHETSAFEAPQVVNNLTGDVANAIVAYGVTKALIPLRIALSLYLTPALSRGFIEPARLKFLSIFRWKS